MLEVLPVLSWMDRGPVVIAARADFEADVIVGEREDATTSGVIDDMLRGVCGSMRCKSCGAQCSAFGARHAPGCDLDRTVSAQVRWQRRHPEAMSRYRATSQRLKLIRQRWAGLNGRCVFCIYKPQVDGSRHCGACLERAKASNRAGYARRLERKAAA